MWILGETLKYFTVHSSRSCQTWHNLNFAFNMESPLVFSTHNYPLDLFNFFLNIILLLLNRWRRCDRNAIQGPYFNIFVTRNGIGRRKSLSQKMLEPSQSHKNEIANDLVSWYLRHVSIRKKKKFSRLYRCIVYIEWKSQKCYRHYEWSVKFTLESIFHIRHSCRLAHQNEMETTTKATAVAVAMKRTTNAATLLMHVTH